MPNAKRGGRGGSLDASSKLHPTLPNELHKCLEFLAQTGRFGGTTKTEVAAYLITRALDDLTRSGVLPVNLDRGAG